MNTDLHCQDCGAITRRDRDDDGFEYAICTNDECHRIVVALVAAPEPDYTYVSQGARPE